MAEHEDTSAVLRRLEAALNRIAAQVAKPRPVPAAQDVSPGDTHDEEPANDVIRHEIVAKLDDLIGGLRTALGGERHS